MVQLLLSGRRLLEQKVLWRVRRRILRVRRRCFMVQLLLLRLGRLGPVVVAGEAADLAGTGALHGSGPSAQARAARPSRGCG